MPIDWHFHTIDPYLEVRPSGKLGRHEYERLRPLFEQLVREEGPLRVLCDLSDFHGWTAGGAWAELKFDIQHFDDIDRLALVGEKHWHQSLAHVCRALTTAEVRYFRPDELELARLWLLRTRVPGRSSVEIGTGSLHSLP
jgi:hypothetical protein